MPSFIRPNTANGIQRMFFRRLGRGISSCARTAQSRNSLPPSSFCPFSHQLSIVSPMAPDFPDRDPEPTVLDRFPIRCQARCKPCEKPLFQAVSGLNKVDECIDQPLIAPCLDLSGESPFAVRPVGQGCHLACHDLVPIHFHAPYLRCIEKEGHLFPDAPSTP